jgi:DNA-directed RNA polymerase subunit RPC12/RpoP
MTRLLVLLLLAYLVYLGLQTLMGRLRGAAGGNPAFRPDPPPPRRVTVTVHREEAEELVPCSRCGVRVPASRTALENGEVVCGSCGSTRPTPPLSRRDSHF